jgi:hypothetical protein
MNPSNWQEFEGILKYWRIGDIIERDFFDLEEIDWDTLDEKLILDILKDDVNYSHDLWEFIQKLSQFAIENSLRNITVLTFRLFALIFLANKANSKSPSQITSHFYFWELLSFHAIGDFVLFDEAKRSFAIGKKVKFSFHAEIIPQKYRLSAIKRFSPNDAKNIVNELNPENGKILRPLFSKHPIINNQPSGLVLVEPKKDLVSDVKRKLNACPPGKKDWKLFEDIGVEIFKLLFSDSLGEPDIQSTTRDGLHRRDALFPNKSKDGFWHRVITRHDAQFIIVDFKNYEGEVGQESVDQIVKYVNQAVGHFGIVWTRNAMKKNTLDAQLKAFRDDKKAVVLVILDKDVIKMCELKMSGKRPEEHLSELYNTTMLKF